MYLDRTLTLTMEGRFLRMMMKSRGLLLRRNGSREETVKYIRLETFLLQQYIIHVIVNSKPTDTGSLCGGSGLRS